MGVVLCILFLFLFFFFKQKTAYEMRISYWISDVCSSDLAKGFDFYSAHLLLKPSRGVFKKIVLGDYLLQFGQGLVLWNGFSLGKGPAALNIARQGRGIRAHSSAGESYFFRGLATTRSEEGRVGKECVSTCRSRGWA